VIRCQDSATARMDRPGSTPGLAMVVPRVTSCWMQPPVRVVGVIHTAQKTQLHVVYTRDSVTVDPMLLVPSVTNVLQDSTVST